MKKLRLKFKRLLLIWFTKKEIIPFNDCGKDTELRIYRMFGTIVKMSQYAIPTQYNDEQSEYLGILRP